MDSSELMNTESIIWTKLRQVEFVPLAVLCFLWALHGLTLGWVCWGVHSWEDCRVVLTHTYLNAPDQHTGQTSVFRRGEGFKKSRRDGQSCWWSNNPFFNSKEIIYMFTIQLMNMLLLCNNTYGYKLKCLQSFSVRLTLLHKPHHITSIALCKGEQDFCCTAY